MKNTTFDSIMVHRKPGEDEATAAVIELITMYGAVRDIPVKFQYPDNVEERVLIISVGGDGTMLAAMRTSTIYPNSTIVGFNTGTLGFLTEELPDVLYIHLDHILFNQDVILEERMILKGVITLDDVEYKKYTAVNEFVLTGQSINAPIYTNIYINEHYVGKQLGNGVLVSSSTGSTAMSLSAGGAIVSPATNIIQVVPLVSHTLTRRPIISTGRDTIQILSDFTDRVPVIEIHGDGQTLLSVNREDVKNISFTIERHPVSVKIWRPKDWNFFNVLREKMKW